jgi:hypothetical protein
VLHGLDERQLDGMVLVSLRPGPALLEPHPGGRRSRLPRSAASRTTSPPTPCAWTPGAARALGVEHMLDQGRRCVALVNGTPGTVPAEPVARRATAIRPAGGAACPCAPT